MHSLPKSHDSRRRALVLVGHGSHYHAQSSKPTRLLADALRDRGLFHEVVAAFWKEEPNLARVFDLVDSDDVFIVPYFMSDGYFTRTVIPRELGLDGKVTSRENRRFFYSEPVGSHPLVAKAIQRCVANVVTEVRGAKPQEQEITVILSGHGTTRDEHSAQALLEQVRLLAGAGIFGDVLAAFMEEEPFDRDVLAKVKTRYAVVIPFFISDGLHSREDLPVNLGLLKGENGEELSNPILNPAGSETIQALWLASALGEEPWMAEVVLDRVRELESFASQPFSPGLPRELTLSSALALEVRREGELSLGELLIKAQGSTFSVRHGSDRQLIEDHLRELKENEEIYSMTETTARGDYRPLRSAVNLQRGWIIKGLKEEGLYRTVDLILPGALAARRLFQEGKLQVKSFQEVAARQSGIYSIVRELTDEQIREVATECCSEGCCSRTPLWSSNLETSDPIIFKKLTSSSIPCPEACSFVIAQAQRHAKSLRVENHEMTHP
jgi:sirohydrochlorin cobaltochelatase